MAGGKNARQKKRPQQGSVVVRVVAPQKECDGSANNPKNLKDICKSEFLAVGIK